MNEEDEAFEDLAKRQGDWGMQGSRKHQIMRYAENVENKGTSMTDKEALIERLATTCLGLDAVDPLRLLVGDVVTALAQPEQEPVAWGVDWGKAGDIPCVSIIKRLHGGGIEVVAVEYAPYSNAHPPAQPQRTWVGLTDEDKHMIELSAGITEDDDGYIVSQVFKLTEAKLKEKNGL